MDGLVRLQGCCTVIQVAPSLRIVEGVILFDDTIIIQVPTRAAHRTGGDDVTGIDITRVHAPLHFVLFRDIVKDQRVTL